MRKSSTIGVSAVGVRAVTPKAATAPRRSPLLRANEGDEDAPEPAPPPPGMGKLIDKSA